MSHYQKDTVVCSATQLELYSLNIQIDNCDPISFTIHYFVAVVAVVVVAILSHACVYAHTQELLIVTLFSV